MHSITVQPTLLRFEQTWLCKKGNVGIHRSKFKN